MGKRTNMKNILIALFLFAATVNAQQFKVTFLPDGEVMIAPELPEKHNGTFTYFVIWDVEFGYCKVIVTANVY